jgi:hypothetical protein
MKKVTSSARGKRAFPMPVDINAGRRCDEREDEDENEAFQKANLTADVEILQRRNRHGNFLDVQKRFPPSAST